MSTTTKLPVSILCVDDDQINLDILQRYLSASVDAIYFAANGREGHAVFLEKRPDIVLTDLLMPEIDGLEMSRMIRSVVPKIPIILLTSCSSIDFLGEAIDVGVNQFLPKPIAKEKLLTAMLRCYDIIDIERRIKDEHDRADAHLLRNLKLESLSVLARGVAHNFNNILTAIIGNAAMAMMRLPEDSPARKFLQNIEKSADRAAEIAKQMLEYSGNAGMMITPVNLNIVVLKMQSELDMILPVGISKIVTPADSLSFIKGDADQLRQVVMNLFLNAIEAMKGHGGSIRISTGCMVCSRSYLNSCWFSDGATEGEYVFLEVSDNGCGMNKETISRMFDPFFTTKFIGRGLGMAAVMGIVRWHRGAIHILSTQGVGSTFKILFPAISEQAEESGGKHA